MTSIDLALDQLAEVVRAVDVTHPPEGRVWVHPRDHASIDHGEFPFVVVSKMNTEPGSWRHESFGVGLHVWDAVVAVYLAPGPIVVTNTDELTINALEDANEWYEALANQLMQNLTLGGTVKIIGAPDGDRLYEYITDNIIWDGNSYYGHLFIITVYQTVVQGASA